MREVRGDSPRGSWRFLTWSPAGLSGMIDHLWSFTGPTVELGKRVLPNGKVELLINLSDPYHEVGRGALPAAWISGHRAAPLVLLQPRYQDVVAARLHPAGAYALLGVPLREVTGLSVELSDAIGDVAALTDALAELGPTERRLHRLGEWLAARMRAAPSRQPGVSWVAAAIEQSGGRVTIGALRNQIGLSEARLVAAFRDEVGLPPKRYARVIRLSRALGRLQAGERSLADVAARCGYYDQAHMNREFRWLGGVTPRQFVARVHPVGDGTTARDPLVESARQPPPRTTRPF